MADFCENGVYHIYNRTNNQEKLFLSDENRHFFLRKYYTYLSHYLDTFCWCLLPNHFHLLARVKTSLAIKEYLETKKYTDRSLSENRFLNNKIAISELIENSFKRFFQSYSLSFNAMYNRKGNLFYKPFKRVEVNKASHLTQAIVYIHANPLKHQITNDFTSYKWSSWQSLISEKPTLLLREEVIDWFGSKEVFINTHKEMAGYYHENDTALED